ncbi:hypothetical protein Tco_0066462 [Tanacetum coccineum]
MSTIPALINNVSNTFNSSQHYMFMAQWRLRKWTEKIKIGDELLRVYVAYDRKREGNGGARIVGDGWTIGTTIQTTMGLTVKGNGMNGGQQSKT